MPTLFSLPKQYVADMTGAPLMGAQLWFYASGSSTPLATYADEGLSVANANPMTADSFGIFGAIWLQNALYRVTLTDAGGVTQWTVDGVGDDLASVATLAGDNALSGDNTFSGSNTFSGNNTFSGDNTFSGSNTVSGTTTHSGPLNVTGTATLTDAVAKVLRLTQINVTAATDIAWQATGAFWRITGTTTINTIATPTTGGTVIVLLFTEALTVNDEGTATGNLRLAGAANFSATADDTMVLIWNSTDSKWHEMCRSVN